MVPDAPEPNTTGERVPPAAPGYRADIDGLRALAVLAVVVYHYLPGVLPGGFVGVDVFFVVSGFLITKLNLRRIRAGSFSFVDFYARRARRLLPAMAIVVLVTLLVGARLYSAAEQSALGHSAAAAALYGANIHHFLTSDYFASPVETRPLLHLWSLGVEEQFYFVAPLGLWALARRPRLLWWTTLIGVGASLAGCLWATWHWPGAAFYLTPFRGWELGLGALLGIRPWSEIRPAVRAVLGWVGLAMVLGSCLWLDPNRHFPGWQALVPTVGTLILVGVGPEHGVGRLLSIRPLRSVGRWSYAWYLWHWPALAFASFLWMRAPTTAEAAALALGTLALAATSTRLIETPLRHWRTDRPWHAVQLGLALSTLLAVVGLSNHDPSLASASTDGRMPVQQALEGPVAPCADFPKRGHDVAACAPGPEAASPQFLVWGDSHVAVLGVLFDRWAHASNRSGRLIGFNDCPPIFGVNRNDVPVSHRCAAHNEAIHAWIRRTRPALVVLHARWTLVFEGTRYADTNKPDPRFVQAGSVDRPPRMAEELRRTVEALRALDVQVVLLGPIPESTFHVGSVYERTTRLGLTMPDGPTRAQVATRTESSWRALEAVAALPGVTLLDPTSVLCGTERCRVVLDGEPLYDDDNHLLRNVAADMLRPLLETISVSDDSG